MCIRDRYSLLHRDDDHVADGGVFTLGAAQHLDAHDAARAGIVRHVEIGLHLNHGLPHCFSCGRMILTTPSFSRPAPPPSACLLYTSRAAFARSLEEAEAESERDGWHSLDDVLADMDAIIAATERDAT